MNSTDTIIQSSTIKHRPNYFGKYRVHEKIGEGAMGSVFKAYDSSIGRFVAIKTISPGILLTDETGEFKARFMREVKAIGKINHSNIISIFDSGEFKGEPFFVMEYVDGKELKEHLSNGSTISVTHSFKMISQVLDALSYSHECGIIHRDIKPSNIFIDTEEKVKIADFGIAKQTDSEFTQCGAILGTPSYMSPEQCQGIEIDQRSDIFSAAVVFYEMLTGEKCFSGASNHAIMHKTISSTPEQPSKLNLHIPQALDKIILKALSKKPNARYQTAKEFKNAISTILSPKNEVAKTNHYIKYASLSIIGIALISLAVVVSLQKINWSKLTFPYSLKTDNESQIDIAPVNLTNNNKILRLLKVAKAHNLVGRHIAPQGSNAYVTYKLILNIDPKNKAAKQGLLKVRDLLLEQIKQLVSQGKTVNATLEIKIALALFPNDKQYLRILETLEK